MSRIITRLPLETLETPSGVPIQRAKYVDAPEIRELLKGGVISFVVANIGDPFRWIPEQDRFAFWKGEAKDRIADPRRTDISLEDFQDCWFYWASIWEGLGLDRTIVVLEKEH
ncbi:MAG: hypothetical protein QM755_15635 [Luteolibacter sp.]